MKSKINENGDFTIKEAWPDYVSAFKRAIEVYNEMGWNHPISGDDKKTGTCFIIFKGDEEMCEKIKELIDDLKK